MVASFVFRSRVVDDENEPDGSSETAPCCPGSQPATPDKEKVMEALAIAFELAAELLEAGGSGGPATAARATALLLRLIAVLGRSNDQM
ncbi:hypothetical protein [Micromonospora rifamycinica]|uniref:hypothetical protein n=1 Tax=Micromonospora rifamycinica TaxID=291594 RepID=UPI0012F79360|nr:hypothetical protein [Micromonospora rifamycinica]